MSSNPGRANGDHIRKMHSAISAPAPYTAFGSLKSLPFLGAGGGLKEDIYLEKPNRVDNY